MPRTVGAIGKKYQEAFQLFCRMEARGCSTREIIKTLWGVELEDKDYKRLRDRCSLWRKQPEYEKIWLDELGMCGRRLLTKGLRKIRDQISSDNDWLANKAANDAVNYAKGRIFGESEKTVTVKIEGMPELGTPDQQE